MKLAYYHLFEKKNQVISIITLEAITCTYFKVLEKPKLHVCSHSVYVPEREGKLLKRKKKFKVKQFMFS